MAVEKCTATSKQSGERCKRYPVPGLTVCKMHGGGSKAAKQAAARNIAQANAARSAAQIGLPLEISPQQALLDEVQRSAGMVAFYQDRVNEVTGNRTGDLIFSLTKYEEVQSETLGNSETTTTEAGVHVWLQLLNEERDRLTRVSLAAIKAGIAERRVQLAEQQGHALVGVIRAILARLDLNPSQVTLASTVVPEELRALSA